MKNDDAPHFLDTGISRNTPGQNIPRFSPGTFSPVGPTEDRGLHEQSSHHRRPQRKHLPEDLVLQLRLPEVSETNHENFQSVIMIWICYDLNIKQICYPWVILEVVLLSYSRVWQMNVQPGFDPRPRQGVSSYSLRPLTPVYYRGQERVGSKRPPNAPWLVAWNLYFVYV